MVNKWIYRPSLCLVVHPWRKNDLPYRSHKLTVRRSFHGLIMNDVCWAKGTPQTTKNVSSIFCWIKFARIYFQLDFWYFHTAKRSLTVAWRKMQQCCLLLSFLLCLQDWRDVVNSKDRTSSRFRRASTKIHTQQKQRTSKNVKKKTHDGRMLSQLMCVCEGVPFYKLNHEVCRHDALLWPYFGLRKRFLRATHANRKTNAMCMDGGCPLGLRWNPMD